MSVIEWYFYFMFTKESDNKRMCLMANTCSANEKDRNSIWFYRSARFARSNLIYSVRVDISMIKLWIKKQEIPPNRVDGVRVDGVRVFRCACKCVWQLIMVFSLWSAIDTVHFVREWNFLLGFRNSTILLCCTVQNVRFSFENCPMSTHSSL